MSPSHTSAPDHPPTGGIVRLWRVPLFTRGAWPGHLFLETPDGCFGWWPCDISAVNWVLDYFRGRSVPGEVSRTDEGWIRDGQAREAARWTLADDALERLRRSIAENQQGVYQLGNRAGGRNCVGWALERLRDAGVETSVWPSPETRGLAPWSVR